MNDYCIIAQKGRININRIIDGKLEAIHFQGEAWLKANNWWPVFRNKIEYTEGEQIALLVLSDDTTFAVDPEIAISEQFYSSKEELARIVNTLNLPGHSVYTYPETGLRSPTIIKQKLSPDLAASKPPAELDQNSLQGFFLRKTEEYKRD